MLKKSIAATSIALGLTLLFAAVSPQSIAQCIPGEAVSPAKCVPAHTVTVNEILTNTSCESYYGYCVPSTGSQCGNSGWEYAVNGACELTLPDNSETPVCTDNQRTTVVTVGYYQTSCFRNWSTCECMNYVILYPSSMNVIVCDCADG